MDEHAATTLDPECGMDPLSIHETSIETSTETSSAEEAPLSRFELLAVRLGAWAGGVAERWAFSSGPFFAFDGRPMALCAPYDDGCRPRDRRPQDCQPATPEA